MKPVNKGLHDHYTHTLFLVLGNYRYVRHLKEAPSVTDNSANADSSITTIHHHAMDTIRQAYASRFCRLPGQPVQ